MNDSSRGRRTMIAREAAAKYGVSTRTVKRIISEPREDFLARAKDRRDRVVELRATGLKQREIAVELGIPIGTVGRILAVAKKLAEQEQQESEPKAS